jgi:hypothetical protein
MENYGNILNENMEIPVKRKTPLGVPKAPGAYIKKYFIYFIKKGTGNTQPR